MKTKIGLVLLTIVLLECSCFSPKNNLKDDNKSEDIIMYTSFTADKATCFCIDQYSSNEVFINAIDSIVGIPFTCDTTYEKGLGYVVFSYLDSANQENLTIEQVRLLDIYYSSIHGVLVHDGYLFLLSGNIIIQDLFQSEGNDTCLIGFNPELLLQKNFLAPCRQWNYIYNGHVLEGKQND
jgi:hypothetical protein